MTDETYAGLIDDILSYEIPEEPTTDWLAHTMFVDFIIYEPAIQANPSLITVSAHKNRVLRAYGRGSLKPKSAIQVLRWVYKNQLDQSHQVVTDELGTRYISCLRKLLSKPDEFFVEALKIARPALQLYSKL